jgi:homoserine dehydrogenase
MKKIGVGLLGFGTIGAGVVEGLQKNGGLLADRLGLELEIRRIADLDLVRDRGVTVDRSILTQDARAVVDDPACEVIIELIGGTTLARELILRSIELGKPVVTANKALLAEHGAEIFRLARAKGVDIYFEASVGGGIPIIRALREGLIANRIDSLYAILNGTCNYILTRMESEAQKFDRVLKDAQAAGYAEADPGLDIDGHDTAHKALILASLAYGCQIPMDKVHVEGIRGLAEVDMENALGLGYRIKLLAVIHRQNEEIEVRVHPTLVPLKHLLASVSGVFNAVLVNGDVVGPTLYYGRGAGRLPTASAVIGDLADVARNLSLGTPGRVPALTEYAPDIRFRPVGDIESRYYLRISVLDRPGVLGQIASILGRYGISIASVIQKEAHVGRHVGVVIVTHRARELDFDAALTEIDAMPAVSSRTVRYRIEDFDGQ